MIIRTLEIQMTVNKNIFSRCFGIPFGEVGCSIANNIAAPRDDDDNYYNPPDKVRGLWGNKMRLGFSNFGQIIEDIGIPTDVCLVSSP